MGTCSVCNKEIEDEYFIEEQDKCVLHCEKNEYNGWIIDRNVKRLTERWDNEKVSVFWKYYEKSGSTMPKNSKIPPLLSYNLTSGLYIYKSEILDNFEIDILHEDKNETTIQVEESYIHGNFNIHLYTMQKDIDISFTKNIHHGNINIHSNTKVKLWLSGIKANELNLGVINTKTRAEYNHIVIVNALYKITETLTKLKWSSSKSHLSLFDYQFHFDELLCNYSKIKKIDLNNSNISEKFIMNGIIIDEFDCSNSVFEKKVELKNNNIKRSSFHNTKFKALCDFYKTKFYIINFNKTTFEDISVFTESVFHKKVDFKFTTFKELALFRKTVFKDTLNLEDSIIKEEANFLEVSSREDKIEDIEVENRETARIIKNSFEKENNIIEANKFYALEMKEMEKELKFLDNPFQWLVFKAHSISSNHSQDWILPILWILNLALFYSMSVSTFYHNNALANISVVFMLILLMLFRTTLLKIMLAINLVIIYLFSYIKLDTLADKINPFSIMTSKDPITFGLLLFKITIAYLIYQFIVSVRQNTRRK